MHRWNDIGQCINRGCAAHPGEDVHCPCPRQTGPSAQLAAAREAAATPIHVHIYDYSAPAVNVQHLRVSLAEVDRITACVAEFLAWMDRYGLGSDSIDLGPPVRRLRQGVLSPREEKG